MQIGITADAATLAKIPAEVPLDFIEGWVAECLMPEATDDAYAPRAREIRAHRWPMPASNRFFPASLRVSGPAVDLARVDRFAASATRRAAEIGMKIIVFGSGGARMVPEGFSMVAAFEHYVDLLKRLAPFAQQHGTIIAVEPLWRGETNLVNTILEGGEAVRRANHPAIKLLVDSYHMARNGESFDDIAKVAPLICHAHISEDRDRAPLGTHGEDLRPYLRALRRGGYDGRLTLEPVWTDIAAQAGPCVAELRRQLVASGY